MLAVRCELSVLSTILFLPQMTVTRKSPGPLSTAQGHAHPDSQSRKLSTVISSLSDLRLVKKYHPCGNDYKCK